MNFGSFNPFGGGSSGGGFPGLPSFPGLPQIPGLPGFSGMGGGQQQQPSYGGGGDGGLSGPYQLTSDPNASSNVGSPDFQGWLSMLMDQNRQPSSGGQSYLGGQGLI